MKCSIKKFSEMYETVYRDLYRYALCLMKNPQEAEDAVSEAVIAAYENIHKLKKGTDISRIIRIWRVLQSGDR